MNKLTTIVHISQFRPWRGRPGVLAGAVLLALSLLFAACTQPAAKKSVKKKEKLRPKQYLRYAHRLGPQQIKVAFRLLLDESLQDKAQWQLKPPVAITSLSNITRWGRPTGEWIANLDAPLDENTKYTLQVGIRLKAIRIADKPKRFYPFGSEIKAMEAKDKQSPPPKGIIVMVGSSSFRMWWNMEQDMLPYKVLNRGFGGAMIDHVLGYMDRIVLPYQPKKIVMYCGENDIAAGFTPQRVLKDFQTFVERCRTKLPTVKIYYVCMKPSPARWSIWDKFQVGNRLIEKYCTTDPGLTFIDVSKKMIKQDGTVRKDIYTGDMLHMNKKGYTDIWAPMIKAALK